MRSFTLYASLLLLGFVHFSSSTSPALFIDSNAQDDGVQEKDVQESAEEQNADPSGHFSFVHIDSGPQTVVKNNEDGSVSQVSSSSSLSSFKAVSSSSSSGSFESDDEEEESSGASGSESQVSSMSFSLHLTSDDFERAKSLPRHLLVKPANKSIFTGSDHQLGLFEGDIVVSSKENAVSNPQQLWPQGRIPYMFDPSSGFSAQERSVFAAAIQQYHDRTCIKLYPRTNEQKYIRFYRGNGCNSPVGMVGRNDVSIGQGCVHVGTIVHEIMHSVGFWHEQSRPDRDQYISIVWNNIQPQFKFAYDIAQGSRLIERYDYLSVMHYDQFAFSVQPGVSKTIITRDPQYQNQIGNRPGFSDADVRKINTLYNCQTSGFYG